MTDTSSPAGPTADPTVTPNRIPISLTAGTSFTTAIQVFTGDLPIGKGDVMFVFDLTGSMSDELNQAKSSAL